MPQDLAADRQLAKAARTRAAKRVDVTIHVAKFKKSIPVSSAKSSISGRGVGLPAHAGLRTHEHGFLIVVFVFDVTDDFFLTRSSSDTSPSVPPIFGRPRGQECMAR